MTYRQSWALALMLGLVAQSWAGTGRTEAMTVDSDNEMQAFMNYMKAGKKREANELLEKVIAASPEKAGPYALLIGGMLAQNGQYREAVPLYQEAIRLNPDEAPAYFYLGIAYHALDKQAESDEIWDQLAERFPEHPLTYYQAGLRHLKVNQYEDAKASLQKAVERLEPANPQRADALKTIALIDQKLAEGK